MDEIAPVAQGLKADDVELQHGLKERHAPWQLEKDIERGERDVKEETDPRRYPLAPQLRAQIHQMVVVHPDEIVRVGVFRHHVRELAVDLAIGAPVRGVEITE